MWGPIPLLLGSKRKGQACRPYSPAMKAGRNVSSPSGALFKTRRPGQFSQTLKSRLGGWVLCGPMRTTSGEDCSTGPTSSNTYLCQTLSGGGRAQGSQGGPEEQLLCALRRSICSSGSDAQDSIRNDFQL